MPQTPIDVDVVARIAVVVAECAVVANVYAAPVSVHMKLENCSANGNLECSLPLERLDEVDVNVSAAAEYEVGG